MNNWILLTYSLPNEPSARRVYVWRKLKRLGAITLFDAVWVLPETLRTHEQFQWLAAEIQEMGGEAMFWTALVGLAGQEEALIERFSKQVDQTYQALLDNLALPDGDQAKMAQEYQQIHQKDYFQSEVGLHIRDRLLTARKGLV